VPAFVVGVSPVVTSVLDDADVVEVDSLVEVDEVDSLEDEVDASPVSSLDLSPQASGSASRAGRRARR
jgi:hypothetical protein